MYTFLDTFKLEERSEKTNQLVNYNMFNSDFVFCRLHTGVSGLCGYPGWGPHHHSLCVPSAGQGHKAAQAQGEMVL